MRPTQPQSMKSEIPTGGWRATGANPEAVGSPCEAVWSWIEQQGHGIHATLVFQTKEETLKYARSTGANKDVLECIENYPWDETAIRLVRRRGHTYEVKVDTLTGRFIEWLGETLDR